MTKNLLGHIMLFLKQTNYKCSFRGKDEKDFILKKLLNELPMLVVKQFFVISTPLLKNENMAHLWLIVNTP